jgi:hypoxanthine phosphoribosyltransferase
VRIEPLFDQARVHERIAELAEEIARGQDGAPLTLVSIAQGAVRFADALQAALAARGVATQRIDVQASRTRGTRLAPVRVGAFDPEALDGRDVLVVDDVADEGETLRAVLALAAEGSPRTLRSAVLVDKGGARRAPLRIDWAGFRVASGWVVGFGMDLDGAWRELDWIGRVVDERF